MHMHTQEFLPPLRDPPSSEGKQQYCISEKRTMILKCLKFVQDFHSPPEAWGKGGAKHIYLIVRVERCRKKRFLLTHSP